MVLLKTILGYFVGNKIVWKVFLCIFYEKILVSTRANQFNSLSGIKYSKTYILFMNKQNTTTIINYVANQ